MRTVERRGDAGRTGGRGLSGAAAGSGPLLQRDYWGVVADCRGSPSQVMRIVARHFEDFAPREIASFRRREGGRPLRVGDGLQVAIAGAGTFEVRVVSIEPQSLTLATVAGHPEAGRITFGAYRNGRGDVVFHVRSRARSSTRARLLGFRTAGEAMQTKTWTDFVNRVAVALGSGVVGWIQAETRPCADEGDGAERTPTFVAQGD